MSNETDEDDMTPEQEALRESQASDAFTRMAAHLADENERRDMYRDKSRGR
jgi:hypothetical protein